MHTLSCCSTMKLIIAELGYLLVKGKLIKNRYSLRERFAGFLRIYFLTLFIVLGGAGLSLAFFDLTDIERPVNWFGRTMQSQTLVYHFVFACLIAPLIEEMLFRLCLRYSKLNFSVAAGFCFFIFSDLLIKGRGIFGEDNPLSLRIGLVFIIIAIAYSILQSNPVIDDRLTKFWSLHFRLIFYLSVISFGFLHVTNLENSLTVFLLAPMLTLPQMAGGFMFGYIRLKYGILYAVLLHAANNFMPFAIHAMLG